MTVLHVQNISVKYNPSDTVDVLKGIDFQVGAGEKIALIGANGAGKSTLLLSLIGILAPCAGTIEIEKIPLEKKNLKVIRQKIGMIFQNPDDQLFMPTVYEDIAFGPRNYNMPEEEIEIKVDNVLSQLHIGHLKQRLSHQLSGGEKRLVALASVLVMEPILLLMDEPSSFLDPLARRRLIGVLNQLPQTLIITTHDLDMALDVCDRVILLKEGTIHMDAQAKEVLCDKVLLEKCGLELPLSLQRHDQ